MPVAIMHLAAEYRGALLHLGRFLFQAIIALLNARKRLVGLAFLADKHTHELHPFGLS